MSLDCYRLDPLHYYSSPGLSFDACLKMTGVTLELMTDPEQYLFIEKGMRGGVSTISHRFAKANNPYLADGYNSSEDTSYIMYYDCNNLYGTAMSSPLPTGSFRFLTPEEVESFDVMSKPDDASKGYILEVDLEYPSHLHQAHNDYPLAPESLVVSPTMLSPYAQMLALDLGINTNSKIGKLIPNLMPKKGYVLHYRNLKFYMEMGLRVTTIHRVLEFAQSPWLKPYIDFNTVKRQAAHNSFEKDLFKLMNNSVYGKTMQNNRKHLNIQIVTKEWRAKRLVAQPTFQCFSIINDTVTIVKMLKGNVVLDKPIYAGMCILDISKLCMYQFHYQVILPQYGERVKLLFTDTDSLCYHIKTEDIYRDMSDRLCHYDTSDYPPNHPLYSKINAKVLGKFKDECNGTAPLEFVGLRAKMYSILLKPEKDDEEEIDDGNDVKQKKENEKKTAKGVKRSYVAKHIRHRQYRNCLFDKEPTMSHFYNIRSKCHQLHTTKIVKTALSPYDDKRYLLDGVASLAYGHHLLLNPDNNNSSPS